MDHRVERSHLTRYWSKSVASISPKMASIAITLHYRGIAALYLAFVGCDTVALAMPCLYISTNVNLDGVDADPIFSQATKVVSSIVGRPERFVMVILKGSLKISFEGNHEPAAYAELVAMGGINSVVKRKLIAAIGSILEDTLLVPRTRFFLKVYDTKAGQPGSKL